MTSPVTRLISLIYACFQSLLIVYLWCHQQQNQNTCTCTCVNQILNKYRLLTEVEVSMDLLTEWHSHKINVMETDTEVNNVLLPYHKPAWLVLNYYTKYSYNTNGKKVIKWGQKQHPFVDNAQFKYRWFTIASASETGLAGFISC